MRAFVNGTHFRNAAEKKAAIVLMPGDEVQLEAEPTNKYDPNAIKVLSAGFHIGYIQRDIAAVIKAEDVVSATVRADDGAKILLDLELR